MNAHLWEWLNVVVRLLHLTAGVAWIGASFYFNWLEGHLDRRGPHPPGVAGDLWAVHGGGFYHVSKYQVAPEKLPETLHWFKWEAYTTWLSGFFLLLLLYFGSAPAYLLNPVVPWVTTPIAISVALGTLLASWVGYDLLCRSPLGHRPPLMLALGAVILGAMCWGLGQLVSPRAAWLLCGAAIATCMAGNVFFVIIPSQRRMVDAMLKGEAPDPAAGKMGLQRSRHNNYLTLPVLLVMISNHYPFLWSGPLAWLVLLGVGAAGVLIRHFFNLRHQGQERPGLLVAAGAVVLMLGVLTRPADATAMGTVSDARVMEIVGQRCASCHAERPTQVGITAAPKGVMLEHLDQLLQHRATVQQQAIVAKVMPLGNLTQMTDDERDELAAWLAAHP